MPYPPPTASAVRKFVWKGTKELVRKGKGRWSYNAQNVTCTLRYEGPVEACFSSAPEIGSTIAGYTSFGVKIVTVDIEDSEAGRSLMTIVLASPNAPVVTSDFGAVGDPIPRLLWQPYRRRIESHPLCGKGPMTGADGHIPQDKYTEVSGGWDWDDYQSLINAGYTEYDEAQPVLTLESFHFNVPTELGFNNYALDDPDPLCAIPAGNWRWLRGGDDFTRENRMWRFLRSWTGFRPGPDRNSAFELLYESFQQ